jgi:hypothetical protein
MKRLSALLLGSVVACTGTTDDTPDNASAGAASGSPGGSGVDGACPDCADDDASANSSGGTAGSRDPGTNIGDGNVEVSAVKQVTPDGFDTSDLWYGQEDPWNSDFSRIMYWENDNLLDPDGEYGLGLVWARVADIEAWATLAEYKAARHPLNPYPYQYASQMEWSPFAGEETIVYAARLSDRMIVKIDVDSGQVEPVVSYDPDNGAEPMPLLRRWTLDNHLIVMLDGADDLSPWVNGVFEVDVQSKTRTYWGPPTTMDYWSLPTADRVRWPYVVAHHGSFSPDHTMAVDSNHKIASTTDYALIAEVQPITDPYASSINHTTWRSSQAWFLVDDLGQNYQSAIYSNAPNIDNFAIHQCFVDGHCRPILETSSAQDYNEYPVNWPTSPIATVRSDGRQFVFTTTNGKYSKTDFDNYGVTPWSHRTLFLANLVPAN